MASDCTDLADYQWLIGAEAADVLRDLADRTAGANGEPLHAAAGRLRGTFSAERVHLLLEQVELRRRAVAKFASPERMFFTRLGLEQATDQWVARYKAQRFAELSNHGPLADLCCGIGGDLLAIAECGTTIGVDRDPVGTCLASANTHATLSNEVASTISLQTHDIEQFAACGLAAWHIDPDRRPSGHRTTSLDWSSPNQTSIDKLLAACPDSAVKLAPAADVPPAWAERCELEWIGRGGQCRQLVAWHGELARSPGQRRATVLANDGGVTRTIVGQSERSIPFAAQLDRYLFEPEPAVLAARLAGVVAAEHGLSKFSPGIAYLTGPAAIDDPALACLEVEEVLPLKLKLLTEYLRQRGVGRLEIKKRGVEQDPEQLRRALKLAGDDAATLILAMLNRKRVAIVAKRIDRGEVAAPPNPESRVLNPPHAACL